VPVKLASLLAEHSCETAMQRGWHEIRNGELLRLAEQEFDLFVTADQNIRYQQNLAGVTIAILDLSTNNWRRIMAASQLIKEAVRSVRPAQHVKVDIP
jgi:hypothetical protein